MKKLFTAFAVIITACLVNVSAQEPLKIYQSTQNGIAIGATEGMKLIQDDHTILHLKSPMITFSGHPLLTEKLTVEALAKMMSDIAASANIKIENMEQTAFSTNTLNGYLYAGSAGNGEVLAVGAMEIKNNDAIVVLFTLTYKESMGTTVSSMLENFEFNADEIE